VSLIGGDRGLGVGMGGGRSIGAEGSTPVIMSCPLSFGTAGEADETRGPHGGTSGKFGKRGQWQHFVGAV